MTDESTSDNDDESGDALDAAEEEIDEEPDPGLGPGSDLDDAEPVEGEEDPKAEDEETGAEDDGS